MRLVRSLLCAGALFAGVFGFAARAEPPPSKYEVLFDAVWKAVDENFYDPSFHGLDWKAIGARYRIQLGGVTGDPAFAALASRMVSELGVSHLHVNPPLASNASHTGIGVRFRTLNGEDIVSEVRPLTDARIQGVHVGDRLLAPARDEIGGEIGTSTRLRLESCDGRKRDVAVTRLGAFWPAQHPAFEWSSTTFAKDRVVGYIRIDRFDDGAAALADQAMAEMKDTSALIIDVRDNSGGNLSAMRLASYFGTRQFSVALLARDYLKPLGHPVTAADVAAAPHILGAYTDAAILGAVRDNKGAAVFVSEDMGAARHTKPVIVLTSEDTGSAAEGFAWEMRLASKATIIGRPTAGYLLSAENFDLPDGWTLAIPTQGIWDGDGNDYQDKPVTPDTAVAWTRADLCSGHDPDIEKALAVLGALP